MRATRHLFLVFLALAVSHALPSAEPPAARIHFIIPAGAADTTLKHFARQSRLEILFRTDAVAGVRTQPVIGHFTARQALTRLLAGTGLIGFHDERSGTVTVGRNDRPPKPTR